MGCSSVRMHKCLAILYIGMGDSSRFCIVLKYRYMMKRLFVLTLVAMAVNAFAQTKNMEPEYIGQVVVINADSTTTLLQKEQAAMKTSSSKFGYIPIPGSGLLDKSKVNLTVKGAESKTMLPEGRVTFIIKTGDNNKDPKDVFGIFQFNVKKNKRQYQLAEAGVLSGVKSTMTFNTVPSEAKKYGENCYLVVIENAEPGQYAIITTDISQVSTFGVK